MEGKAFKALMDIQLSHNCDLIMIAQRLAEERQHFFVSREYELHGLLPGQRSYDAFSDGFGLSINALEARLYYGQRPPPRPHLSDEESELVEKLKGILPDSRAIKDMTNAWLVEAGLSLTPRGMACNEVLEMKSGVGPNAVAATGKQVIDLEVEVKRLRAEVEHMKAAPGDTEQRYQALGREAKKSLGEAEDYRSTRRQLDDKVLKLARDIEALRTKV
ncbi:hypothetical protein B296_00027873 [Ensete ventricosum]|uniref:Uncharacterized protein n=1 Tax=Ensete ventricosum TaxID=4639 RepID=A0A426ZKV0_ENSVE|nr:hypothetical protein B296_00027873 [Ensete ventricosum]